MLPDDFENLSESAIASSLFLNNFLQCITTKNYWAIANAYKPLMHLWYIGVLMQAYVCLPLLYVLLFKLLGKKGLSIGTVSLTFISFVLYLLPSFSSAWKFYYLPFRAFEITAGGLIVEWNPKTGEKTKTIAGYVSLIVIVILLCSRVEIVNGTIMLLLTVIASIVFIWSSKENHISGIEETIYKAGAYIGQRSYSIYIWHQIIAAFLFYSVFPKHNGLSFLAFMLLTVLISLISYRYIEVPIGKIIRQKRKESAVIITTLILSVILCGVSFLIYRDAGVVRDVPELDVYKNNIHRGMHTEYCDRPYAWEKEFSDDETIKVLVIGNSFSRDWANILYEWDTEGKLEISYIYFGDVYGNDDLVAYSERIDRADVVFSSQFSGIEEITVIPKDKYYIIGNKRYGESNGIIYAHRGEPDYFNQTVELNSSVLADNENGKRLFGDYYISLMEPVVIDNKVKVFTDDNKFISQDCMHLTQAGAKYYARILDIEGILRLTGSKERND